MCLLEPHWRMRIQSKMYVNKFYVLKSDFCAVLDVVIVVVVVVVLSQIFVSSRLCVSHEQNVCASMSDLP